MSADLDALDRGLVDVGVTAAEALARVAALEATVAELRKEFVTVYRLGVEHGARRPALRARLAEPRPRHLKPVPNP